MLYIKRVNNSSNIGVIRSITQHAVVNHCNLEAPHIEPLIHFQININLNLELYLHQGEMDILKDISKIGISPVETLQFFTCMLAGIYTGFNLYAVLFEAPSRASLPLHSHWEQWATSFREASKVMVSVASFIITHIYRT